MGYTQVQVQLCLRKFNTSLWHVHFCNQHFQLKVTFAHDDIKSTCILPLLSINQHWKAEADHKEEEEEEEQEEEEEEEEELLHSLIATVPLFHVSFPLILFPWLEQQYF